MPSATSDRAINSCTPGSSSITRTIVPSPPRKAGAAGAGSGAGSDMRAGRRTVKTEPFPDSLVTVTSPPIISAKRRLIARPRPVPPNFRVVEASACVKGVKSFSSCSGVMPMPVSVTAKLSHGAPALSGRVTSRRTVPFSVNLLALDKRLNRICRTLVRSPYMAPAPGAHSIWRALFFFSTSGCTVTPTSCTMRATSNASRYSSIFPASTLDKSSTPFTRASRCLPAVRIFSRSGMKLWTPSSTASSCSNSLYMMTALRGVRNSWLMLARNWLLEELAASACSLAASASFLARCSSSSEFAFGDVGEDADEMRHPPAGLGNRSEGDRPPKRRLILTIQQKLAGMLLILGQRFAKPGQRFGLGIRAAQEINLAPLHLAPRVAGQSLKGGIDISNRLIRAAWIGDENTLGDGTQRAFAQPHALLGLAAAGDIHEADGRADIAIFALDRIRAIFNGEARSVAPPEDFIIDADSLAGAKCLIDSAVLPAVGSAIGPGMVEQFVGGFAGQLLGVVVAEKTGAGGISENAVALHIHAIDPFAGGIEQQAGALFAKPAGFIGGFAVSDVADVADEHKRAAGFHRRNRQLDGDLRAIGAPVSYTHLRAHET